MTNIRTFLSTIQTSVSGYKLTTPAAIIIGALLISASHIAYALIEAGNGKRVQTSYFQGKPVDETDHVEGKKDADVLVIEYSDPECPYCITLHPTLKQLRSSYGNAIGFVYRHFPLTNIHPHAYDESKAIVCAGKLGGTAAYYDYIDKLYGYKSETRQTQLPETGKNDIAGHVGLDKATFTACMNDQATGTVVDASIAEGIQAGVDGTPATFVLAKTRKGYEIVARIDGARPYEYIQAAVEEALSR